MFSKQRAFLDNASHIGAKKVLWVIILLLITQFNVFSEEDYKILDIIKNKKSIILLNKTDLTSVLNENELTLSPASNKDDIKLYIEKQVKKHLVVITESYRQNNVRLVTEAIKADVEPKIHKTLKESFVNNIVWNIISDRIKFGLK